MRDGVADSAAAWHPALRALCVVALLAVAHAAAAFGVFDTFDPARDARADVAQAVALAKAQGKRVIVDVGGEWCPWCHVMERFIAANPDVRALIDARYVWVKVNVSPENRNEALLSRWPSIAGYPHLFVLDADGTLLHSQNTAVLEAGKGYDKAKFVALLRRFASAGRVNRT
jgi:thiol:disulfide interchange protein